MKSDFLFWDNTESPHGGQICLVVGANNLRDASEVANIAFGVDDNSRVSVQILKHQDEPLFNLNQITDYVMGFTLYGQKQFSIEDIKGILGNSLAMLENGEDGIAAVNKRD